MVYRLLKFQKTTRSSRRFFALPLLLSILSEAAIAETYEGTAFGSSKSEAADSAESAALATAARTFGVDVNSLSTYSKRISLEDGIGKYSSDSSSQITIGARYENIFYETRSNSCRAVDSGWECTATIELSPAITNRAIGRTFRLNYRALGIKSVKCPEAGWHEVCDRERDRNGGFYAIELMFTAEPVNLSDCEIETIGQATYLDNKEDGSSCRGVIQMISRLKVVGNDGSFASFRLGRSSCTFSGTEPMISHGIPVDAGSECDTAVKTAYNSLEGLFK